MHSGPDPAPCPLDGWHCGTVAAGSCDLGWLAPVLRAAGAQPQALPEADATGTGRIGALAQAVAAQRLALGVAADLGGAARLAAQAAGLWSLRTTPHLWPQAPAPLQPTLDAPLLMARTAADLDRAARALLAGGTSAPWRRALRWQAAWDRAGSGLQVALAVAWLALQRLGLDGLEVVPQVQPLDDWEALWHDCARHDPYIRAPALADVPARREQVRASLVWTLGRDGVGLLPAAADAGPVEGAPVPERLVARSLALACAAELAGLPQVGWPLRLDGPQVAGLALVGPPGSDLALLALAQRLDAALPAAMRREGAPPPAPAGG